MPVTINGSTGITSPGGDVSTSLTAGSVTTSGTNSVAALTVNGNNISAVNSLGFRNRIINGDMRIDQRNAGASIAFTDASYAVDRFVNRTSQTGKLTARQTPNATETGYATRVAAGFSSYLAFTSLSAYSPVAGDYIGVAHNIEGFNFADMAWGTTNAKEVTLSFWAYSSLTGQMGGAFRNSAQNRSYPFSYTINSANTWEYKTITVLGDTTGTWVGSTNGTGVQVWFNLGTGSSSTGTANTWAAASYINSTGSTAIVGTNGATFYITGVQLEAGTVATPFERRDYGRELMMCQRYYFAEQGGEFDYTTFLNGSGGFANMLVSGKFPVLMRAAPTLAWTGYAGYLIPIGGSAVSPGTDASSALPTSGAPGSVVTSTGGISRASFTLGAGVTRGSNYKNCFGTSLACSAEL